MWHICSYTAFSYHLLYFQQLRTVSMSPFKDASKMFSCRLLEKKGKCNVSSIIIYVLFSQYLKLGKEYTGNITISVLSFSIIYLLLLF